MTATTTDAAATAGTSTRAPVFVRHELGSFSGQRHVGPVDALPPGEILALVSSSPIWPGEGALKDQRTWTRGTLTILTWLSSFPGQGWQERWIAAGADGGTSWLDGIDPTDQRKTITQRDELGKGLLTLLLHRVVLPSYEFLADYQAFNLFSYARQVMRPDLFTRIDRKAASNGIEGRRLAIGLIVITKIVLHTGRDVDQLTAEDMFAYRAWNMVAYGTAPVGIHTAWWLLHGIADLGEHEHLRSALRYGQRPTAELVGFYRIQCEPIRQLLIRYLDERRPAMDYGSFRELARTLAGTFWADIERHHPGIDSLHLPEDVEAGWKQRVSFLTMKGKAGRPRRNRFAVLMRVRAFYLDIQEWALEDPSWAPWAVPCPVRRGDTTGMAKDRRQTTAKMHQRVRDRLPHLPALVDVVERHLAEQTALLTAASATAVGETFEYGGRPFRRIASRTSARGGAHAGVPRVLIENIAGGEPIDVTRAEDEAFWTWAIIETLRHTGVRIEELLEITHLALVSYRLPDTGETIPLLQIVPSKSNEERLLLVSPELASVLATIVTRLRAIGGGAIPLTSRYDAQECSEGPPLPHLFQRRAGWRTAVIGYGAIESLLAGAIDRAGLVDAANRPLRYTPHDFRRMFATEAVMGGLPVHIAARLLGHHSLTTTQAYLAVFQDDLVRAYRAFLDQRRAVRPQAEYREPTDEEWQDFQQHFELRKLELGTCGRPYGTPCKHEHACIRCPSLRLDPGALPRLTRIVRNLQDRVAEARTNGWLGEVQGLQVSLNAAKTKLSSLDRKPPSPPGRITDLGIPIIGSPSRDST